jgi:uncharacterized cupin superfamily protein
MADGSRRFRHSVYTISSTGEPAIPKIDIAALKTDSHTGYPGPFRQAVLGRSRKRLGNAAGLDQFGVNLSTLKPGAASSQRHWHANEDELVYMLAVKVLLNSPLARLRNQGQILA